MQFKNHHSLPACAGALMALGFMLLSIAGPRTQRPRELGHPGPVEADDEGGRRSGCTPTVDRRNAHCLSRRGLAPH